VSSTPQPPSAPLALRLLAYLDITLLVFTLPIFIGAGLPILGWAGGSAAYVAQRLISELLKRSAAQTQDMTGFLGVMVGGVIARGFFVALSIFGVGMIDGDAGAAAGFLFLAAFTVNLTMTLVLSPYRKQSGGKA
jgi:hypothetical protein